MNNELNIVLRFVYRLYLIYSLHRWEKQARKMNYYGYSSGIDAALRRCEEIREELLRGDANERI